jgi:hypothetical protein
MLYIGCTLPEPEDIDPPVIAILYPQSGMTLSDSVTIMIESTDDDKVTVVRCYIDNQMVGSSSGHALQLNLDLQPYADNNIHIISASASDDAGNIGVTDPPVAVTITDGMDRIPPQVQLLYPSAGEINRDIIMVSINATDNEGLNRVVVFIDGDSVFCINALNINPPFQYTWDTTPYVLNSEHTITIKAVDSAGNESYTTPITVTIIDIGTDIIPPTVILLYPLETMILSGNVSVRVDANDNVRVDSVQFYVDGKWEETDYDGEPWGFEWNTASIADSLTHTLYMKAFDSAGNIGSAGPLGFTVMPE